VSPRILLLRTITVAGLAVALIWPALWNRGPFYYGDTRSYIRAADAILHKLTGIKTDWSAEGQSGPAVAGSRPGESADQALYDLGVARTRSLVEIGRKGVLLGRSPYYGLLLYAGALSGGMWLTVLLQGAVLLWAVYLLLRSLGIPAWPLLAYLGAGLCIFSDAPFFVSWLMPDLFAGIAILASAILIAKPEKLAAGDRACWWFLLTVSMLAHDSCVLISVSLLCLAILTNLLRRCWVNWQGLGIILLALLTALSGQSLVAFGIQRATGEAPLRIPFLSARLIADGPGTSYLRATCPGNGFLLCQYASQFPMTTDQFLWGVVPGKSVFSVASYEQRRGLSAEQIRFILAVARFDPSGVLRAMGRNIVTQLFDFRLLEFRYNPGEKDIMDRTFPLQVLTQVKASGAYRGGLPFGAFNVLLYVFACGSIAYLSLALAGRLPGRTIDANLKQLSWWVFAGVVANGAICGGISTDCPRYQARVMWLLPLMALIVELMARMRLSRSSRAPAEGATPHSRAA
jgi:hypothetical protein